MVKIQSNKHKPNSTAIIYLLGEVTFDENIQIEVEDMQTAQQLVDETTGFFFVDEKGNKKEEKIKEKSEKHEPLEKTEEGEKIEQPQEYEAIEEEDVESLQRKLDTYKKGDLQKLVDQLPINEAYKQDIKAYKVAELRQYLKDQLL